MSTQHSAVSIQPIGFLACASCASTFVRLKLRYALPRFPDLSTLLHLSKDIYRYLPAEC